MDSTVKLSTARPPPAPARVDPQALQARARVSHYEATLSQGFPFLRFPPELEARFLQDKADERTRILRMGIILALILSVGMLLPDWMMVPDQLDHAWRLRLLAHALPLLLTLVFFKRIGLQQHERAVVIMTLMFAVIAAHVSVLSKDPLGQPYLVSLAMVLLFNGGVVRLRFRTALMSHISVIAIYVWAVALLNDRQVELLIAIALILVSTAAFSLHGSYWLEHSDRTNWLMLQHEHHLLAELQKGNERLDELSRHDALTGLANRRHVDEFLQQVWRRARQSGEEVALLMIDVDHFKRYNDHYGHPQGDDCLRDVAQTLQACLREPRDLIGRFGGEEFIAILTKTTLAEAMVVAERVRTALQQLARPHAASPTHSIVTVSIGVASLRPGRDEGSPQRLIAQADAALYSAKSGGRNRVVAQGDPG